MNAESKSWIARLKVGLSKTSAKLTTGITAALTHRKLDAEMLAELEMALVQADIGAQTAAKIIATFKEKRFAKEISEAEVKEALAQQIEKILEPVAQPLILNANHKPHVILVVGVNGNGKTTTIGKLAHWLRGQNHSVMLAAADTFRAAAVEQLSIWGVRVGCEVIKGEPNADPASVAYAAIEQAKTKAVDALLIDTAGRLQNKANLMAELEKMIRVIRKVDSSAPHSVIQVLDATTGQNALNQVEVFKAAVQVTGLVITKLDGTAKGGIVVALAERFHLPVHAVGVGEAVDDLQPFLAKNYADILVG